MMSAATAQTMKKYDVRFIDLSPDGKYLFSEEEGTCVVFDVKDSVSYYYGEDGVDSYSFGMGNFSNSMGIVTGSIGSAPAYWKDGKWYELPMGGQTKEGYNDADGVTADGKLIVGSISKGDFTTGTTMTYFPAIWRMNADGTYSDPELLPYPATDFTGRVPQYVTARAVSSDGKVIAGQVQSWDGFAAYPVVWTLDDEGKYQLKEVALDVVCDPNVTFPKYPTYEPEYPSVEDFMSTDEVTAYNEDYAKYNDSLDLYNQQIIDKYPTRPSMEDYLVDPDGQKAYSDAMDKYEKDSQAYSDSVEVFDEVYYTAITGAAFVFNEVHLSANGKYYLSIIVAPDPNADPMSWFPTNIYYPAVIDLETGKVTSIEATNMIGSTVTDEGMVIASSPAVEYTRQAYVVAPGETKPVLFADWVKAKNPAVLDWLKENFSYDGVTYSYDEEYNLVETAFTDSLITGSMFATPDGTKFVSYVWDAFTETGGWNSFFIDLDGGTNAISTARGNDGNVEVAFEGGNLSVKGNVESVSLSDLAGRTVYTTSTDFASIPMNGNGGVYIVRVKTADGNVVTKKIVAGK